MNMRRAFTLVEVAVAGSLIGLCVLTAVSIIPAGLRTQNEARMRAVAAATVMRLSAEIATGPVGGYTVLTKLGATKTAASLQITAWDSNGAVTTSPTDVYQVTPLPAVGDLSRRLVFSKEGSSVNVITAWLLSKDPSNTSDKRATYLATFTERP